MKYTPRPYQELITDYILSKSRCAIFAGMGTGKTSATLTALDTILLTHGGPILILAPLRVATSTWPGEVRKWNHLNHLRICSITGSVKERTAALNAPADIYTMNYDNLVWLTEHYGDAWPFATVVCDESTRLKSFRLRQGGKRSQALGKVAHRQVKRFIELTGTPAPNGLIDLWGQIWFIDVGERLGRTFTAFKERWFRASYDGFGCEPTESAQVQIQGKLSDVCLTIKAEDWFDVKKPIVNDIYVDLPPKARRLYADMEKELFMQLEEHSIEAFNAAAKSQKLLQIASGAVYVGEAGKDRQWKQVHDEKIKALEEIVEEAAGAPVLVAYHFVSDLQRLKKAFPKSRQLDANPETLDDWNAGRIPVLFAHPQSAGHGLNMQDGGSILVFFSHSWSLEDRLQIIERIGPVRQAQSGYDRPVFIHNLIARETIDETVIARIDSKREVQDCLLDALRRRHA